MAVELDVPYENSIVVGQPLGAAFAYVTDVEKHVPATFPGLESFLKKSDDVYEWRFKKIEYGGYAVQILLLTRFLPSPPNRIEIQSVDSPGHSSFTGNWNFEPLDPAQNGKHTRLTFSASFKVQLPVPFFLKAMVEPLAQKELSKLFDRYLHNVEKALAA